jgi:hypothetical protein
MESKTQQKERLRKMRQKYHLGEYKNSKQKVYKHHSSNFNMAKKRHSRKYSKGSTSNLWGSMLGVGGVIVYKSLLSQYIPLSGNTKLFAELALGVWLSRKGGIIGNTAKALVIIDAYQLMGTYVAPMLSGIGSQGGTSQAVYY